MSGLLANVECHQVDPFAQSAEYELRKPEENWVGDIPLVVNHLPADRGHAQLMIFTGFPALAEPGT